jgi:hypothetical protein
MREAITNRLRCWWFYRYGCYRGTGGRVKYVAPDWREVRLEIPLSWRTRNYVGTIFGGSMYGAVDPIYMVMLIQRLGPGYIVWDKRATIHFKRPGRSAVSAHFSVSDEEIGAIRHLLETAKSIDRTYTIDIVDGSGTTCATVEKVIYIRRKN